MMKKLLVFILAIGFLITLRFFYDSPLSAVKNKTPTIIDKNQASATVVLTKSKQPHEQLVKETTHHGNAPLSEQPTVPNEEAIKIVSCLNQATTTPQENNQNQHDQISTYWQSSTSPHEQINASLFTKQATNSEVIKQLLDYHAQFPKSVIVYDRLLDLCSAKNNAYCNADFFDKAYSIDSENGMLLLKIASYHLHQNNEAQALAFIQQAAKRETFDSYHFHYVENAWRSLKHIKPAPDALNTAIGYAASLSWNAMTFSKFCMKQKEIREIDACNSLGQAMQKGARTGFIQVLGGAIEKHYAEQSGKHDLIEEIDAKYRKAIDAISNKDVLQSYMLATYDESLAEEFINNGKHFGEIKAASLLIKEAIWRSKDPNYNPCQ